MKKILLSISLTFSVMYMPAALSNPADSVYEQARELLDSGKQMESLRSSYNVDDHLQCNDTMKSNMVKAQNLESEAQELEVSAFQLKLAAIELHACTSCAKNAIESCNRVDEALTSYKNGS